MTEEEWQHLYKNFETAELLSAVDAVDCLRDDLNDGEGCRPLELRTNLLKLHEPAMNLTNRSATCGWGRAGGQEAGRCVSATAAAKRDRDRQRLKKRARKKRRKPVSGAVYLGQ